MYAFCAKKWELIQAEASGEGQPSCHSTEKPLQGLSLLSEGSANSARSLLPDSRTFKVLTTRCTMLHVIHFAPYYLFNGVLYTGCCPLSVHHDTTTSKDCTQKAQRLSPIRGHTLQTCRNTTRMTSPASSASKLFEWIKMQAFRRLAVATITGKNVKKNRSG